MKRRRIPIWSEAKATQPREFEIRAIRPNEVHAAASMHFEFLGGPEVARCSFLKLGFKFLEAFIGSIRTIRTFSRWEHSCEARSSA